MAKPVYHCPSCKKDLPGWVIKRDAFDCPHCETRLQSNYRASFKRAAALAVGIWTAIVITVCLFSDPWNEYLLGSIEIAIVGVLFTGGWIHKRNISVSLAARS